MIAILLELTKLLWVYLVGIRVVMPSCMVSWTDLFCDPPRGLRSFDIETWLDGFTWFNQVLKETHPKKHPHGTVKKIIFHLFQYVNIYPPLILTSQTTPIWSPSTTAKPTLPGEHPSIHPFVARIKTLINSPATWKSWVISDCWGDFFGFKRDRTRVDETINWTKQKWRFFLWKHGNYYYLLSQWPNFEETFWEYMFSRKRKFTLLFHGLLAE